jgi:hypothetical protein
MSTYLPFTDRHASYHTRCSGGNFLAMANKHPPSCHANNQYNIASFNANWYSERVLSFKHLQHVYRSYLSRERERALAYYSF